MARTPEQIAHARYVRRTATAKIRQTGHDFGGRITDALVCAAIQRPVSYTHLTLPTN